MELWRTPSPWRPSSPLNDCRLVAFSSLFVTGRWQQLSIIKANKQINHCHHGSPFTKQIRFVTGGTLSIKLSKEEVQSETLLPLEPLDLGAWLEHPYKGSYSVSEQNLFFSSSVRCRKASWWSTLVGFKCPSQAQMINTAAILNISFLSMSKQSLWQWENVSSNCGNGWVLKVHVKIKMIKTKKTQKTEDSWKIKFIKSL